MTLAEKWNKLSLEFLRSGRARTLESMREAFYAGAEAADDMAIVRNEKIEAEIDQFRGHKE